MVQFYDVPEGRIDARTGPQFNFRLRTGWSAYETKIFIVVRKRLWIRRIAFPFFLICFAGSKAVEVENHINSGNGKVFNLSKLFMS